MYRGGGFNASRNRRHRKRNWIRSKDLSSLFQNDKMRDHHAMRCSGRLVCPSGVVKYGTTRWDDRYVSGPVVVPVVVLVVFVSLDGCFVSACGSSIALVIKNNTLQWFA